MSKKSKKGKSAAPPPAKNTEHTAEVVDTATTEPPAPASDLAVTQDEHPAAHAEAPASADTAESATTEAPEEVEATDPPPASEPTAGDDDAAESRETSNGRVREELDFETTVNLTGDIFTIPGRDDLDSPTQTGLPDSVEAGLPNATRKHLRGLLEALVFASDHPIKPRELAKTASAQTKEVTEVLEELRAEYQGRGIQLEEIAGGWLFRTSPAYSPVVRDLTKQKPVKLTRAQIETLAILAYRQPITRPEIDEIRGVDSGPVLKILLERDLVRILGKKDEPGRPLLYGTTTEFLEFFGLKSVKDLPTLREFTELSEDSRRVVEQELGETLETVQDAALEADQMAESHQPSAEMPRDTLAPPNVGHHDEAADSVHGEADELLTSEHVTHAEHEDHEEALENADGDDAVTNEHANHPPPAGEAEGAGDGESESEDKPAGDQAPGDEPGGDEHKAD